jgi:N-acyl homoserine lactone hydrolase
MRRFVSIVLASVLAASCAPEASPREEVRLYVFDCGMIRLATVEPFGIDDNETDVRELAVPCYAVEHARGRLLWDGGLPSMLAAAGGWQEIQPGAWVRLDRTLAEQLGDVGLDLGAFDYVAFSHFHFDHIGVANELTRGTVIIQQPEYEAAFAEDIEVFGFEPDLYAGIRGMEKQIIDGDHDVFGDGRVRIISAPGHTPGHQVLFVDLAETGPIVLSGDLYHFRLSRDDRRIPVFNVDAEQTLESMERVESMLVETGAELWIQHELARFEQHRRPPAHYR